MDNVERRFFEAGKIELRKGNASDAPMVARGYAAKFNVLSEAMYGFREQIAPGAFDGCLNDDVRALFNHDPNHILGRTGAGTCRIAIDATGLHYEVDLPDTQAARDLATAIARGDVSQSSFAFRVAPNGDTWDENEDGVVVRTITKIGRLYDVSPVTYPAYPDATVGVRSLEAWKSGREAERAKAAREEELKRTSAARARMLKLSQ